MDAKMFKELDITEKEIKSMTEAFKNKEFRKLLVEYCEEMADPKKQQVYQEELVQYESERGIDLTFITPDPGFVIKIVVDGSKKGFINVCTSEKVAKPTSSYTDHGKPGLNWSIPLTQAPPRKDYDNQKRPCIVYDVVFHPDTLHLATRNRAFKTLVIDTACDAVQSAFQVDLDRTNLKFPKLAFKGTPQPTVLRKKKSVDSDSEALVSSDTNQCNEDASDDDAVELKEYPKIDMANLNGERAPQRLVPISDTIPDYATPKYKIVQRKDVEMHEMTNERDAKMNLTVPKELVLTVDLPLLKTAESVDLDVTRKCVELKSDKPAKYKLTVNLPYPVVEGSGQAKFDSVKRQLVITLPVVKQRVDTVQKKNVVVIDDSGVDSPLNSHSSSEDLIDDDLETPVISFLEQDTAYSVPSFTCNVLDNIVAFTLNVKNVDPESVQLLKDPIDNKWVHVKFYSIGSGFSPSHHAFYVRFEAAAVEDVSVEPWDNNVILQMEMSPGYSEKYWTGLDASEAKEEGVLKLGIAAKKTEKPAKKEEAVVKEEVVTPAKTTTSVEQTAKEVKSNEGDGEEEDEEQGEKKLKKLNKKANRKMRSVSESSCAVTEEQTKQSSAPQQVDPKQQVRKCRSVSESSSGDHLNSPFQFKSILKRRAFNRSISESSVDEQASYSMSFDMGVGSFDNIPEESDEILSESCKKTVHFSDVIRKQLFRADASIVGRKLKNLKKRAKKRAQDARRLSESENSEGEAEKEKKVTGDGNNRRDSGVEFSSDGGAGSSSEGIKPVSKAAKKASKSKSSKTNTADLEFKSGMIFNLEM